MEVHQRKTAPGGPLFLTRAPRGGESSVVSVAYGGASSPVDGCAQREKIDPMAKASLLLFIAAIGVGCQTQQSNQNVNTGTQGPVTQQNANTTKGVESASVPVSVVPR